MITRALWVWLHRWTGLALAVFLIVVGLTGSLLAFRLELNQWLTPDLYPAPRPGVELDAATLARRAEAIVPQARATSVDLDFPGSVMIGMEAREGAPELDFEFLHLDPIGGAELGRVTWHSLPRTKNDIVPFIYGLHMYLAMKGVGDWILGCVALLWTIDCFVGFYLTLPPLSEKSRKTFLTRWKPAWLVKLRGSFYRVNFDLHRAGGLWLWAMLFVYAWSSVYFLMPSVYAQAMRIMFDYEQPAMSRDATPLELAEPQMQWEEALATGQRLMAEQARKYGFTVERPAALHKHPDERDIHYRVRSSRDIGDKSGFTSVLFDSRSGELKRVSIPTGQRSGTTITTWLVELHTANLFGLPYRIFVSAFGLIVATLSVTGVYIWWKKRAARLGRAPAAAIAQQLRPIRENEKYG